MTVEALSGFRGKEEPSLTLRTSGLSRTTEVGGLHGDGGGEPGEHVRSVCRGSGQEDRNSAAPSRFGAREVLAGPAGQGPRVRGSGRQAMWREAEVGGILQEEDKDGTVVRGAVGCTSGGPQAHPTTYTVPGASGPPARLPLMSMAPVNSSPTPSSGHLKKC